MKLLQFAAGNAAALLLAFTDLASGAVESSEKVRLPDLPAVVQKAIHAQVAKGRVAGIEKHTDAGEITYEVEMRKGGQVRSFTVGEAGELLDLEVFLSETPASVQAAIKKQVGANEIEGITKMFDDDEVSYAVVMTGTPSSRTFTLDEQGKLLDFQIFLAEVPPPVQKAIQAKLAGGKLGDITKIFDGDDVTYEVEINPDGKSRTVIIDQAGHVRSREADVTLSEAPEAVQKTARELLKDGQLSGLTKTEEAGEVSYDLEFKRGGKRESVEIGSDGKVLP